MDPGTTFIILALSMFTFVICVVACACYFNRIRRIRAALQSSPRIMMNQAATGTPVKVVGVVQPSNFPLYLAPLTMRPCVYYQARVQEWVRSGKSHRWRTIVEEEIGQDFFINDGTGMVRMPFRPVETMAELEKGLCSASGVFVENTPNAEAFLNRHGQTTSGFFGNRTLRFFEGSLAPGDTVAVLAVFVQDALPGVLCATAPPANMKADEHKIVLSNDGVLFGGPAMTAQPQPNFGPGVQQQGYVAQQSPYGGGLPVQPYQQPYQQAQQYQYNNQGYQSLPSSEPPPYAAPSRGAPPPYAIPVNARGVPTAQVTPLKSAGTAPSYNATSGGD